MAKKDKNTAAFLSLIFGWFGMHQIYLKNPWRALFFIAPLILLQGTFGFFVAMMMGFVNALILMMMPQEQFDQKYNSGQKAPWDKRRDYSRRDYDRERRWENRHQTRRTNNPTNRPTYRRPSQSSRPIRNVRPTAERRKPNPFKISGIQKYKDYDYEGAIEDFQKALEVDKRDIASHFNIACAYSLTEQPRKAIEHLHLAVQNGFADFQKIKTHDDLAFVRIQPEFEKFSENGFKLEDQIKEIPIQEEKDDQLLNQLKKLAELRDKGLITEEEYAKEKRKISRK